ncbi:MAG: TraR/DksA C4-type zinc finger protein [Oligoflexia bacterium]|nr:TraR/DksA C4-type zinc finger protein [Oligoflexia bacterium]MBF0366438.1 TraR/DksA C4-type zinc finger protein [Oligoflexia bacterium]
MEMRMKRSHKLSADFGRALNKSEVAVLRKILEEQKKNLVFKNCQMDEFNLDQEECSDDVDHANADLSTFQRLRFRTRENLYEKKIDESLKRLECSEYGLCKDCGTPINFSRLLARPTADLCIQCKEEAERDELSSGNNQRSRSLGEVFGITHS